MVTPPDKYAFISQPMRNLSDEEILEGREHAEKKLMGMGYKIISSFFEKGSPEDKECSAAKNVGLACLGRSLQLMANADAVYFIKGWKDARGCRIEETCAKEYGIKCIYESDEEDGAQCICSDPNPGPSVRE